MSDPLGDTILLPSAEHTKAKHRILSDYLNGWLPIIGQTSGRMIYLDGMAGSGEYEDGSFGSPILAVDAAHNHFLKSKISCETVFLFVEIHEGRFKHLEELLEKKYGKWDPKTETYAGLSPKYRFGRTNGDFNKYADDILSSLEKDKANLAPTLAFIDPWGYSDLDFDILSRILRFRRCELLVTYMSGYIDRFASEPKHRQSIMKTLGVTAEELDKASAIPEVETRELVWLKYLNDAIVGKTQAFFKEPQPIYSLYFKMLNNSNRTLYYLAYFTKDLKGIEVMKYAMQRVSKGWNYRFSDHDFDPGQGSILDYVNEEPSIREQAESVANHFAGKTVKVDDVDAFVLRDTIWLPRRASLKILLSENRMEIVRGGKTRGSTPPGSILRFR